MMFRNVPAVTVVTALGRARASGFPRRGARGKKKNAARRAAFGDDRRWPDGLPSAQSSEFMIAVRRRTYQKRVVRELKSIRAAATCMFVGKVRMTVEVS